MCCLCMFTRHLPLTPFHCLRPLPSTWAPARALRQYLRSNAHFCLPPNYHWPFAPALRATPVALVPAAVFSVRGVRLRILPLNTVATFAQRSGRACLPGRSETPTPHLAPTACNKTCTPSSISTPTAYLCVYALVMLDWLREQIYGVTCRRACLYTAAKTWDMYCAPHHHHPHLVYLAGSGQLRLFCYPSAFTGAAQLPLPDLRATTPPYQPNWTHTHAGAGPYALRTCLPYLPPLPSHSVILSLW